MQWMLEHRWRENEMGSNFFPIPTPVVLFSHSILGPFSIYEQPKYKPNLTLIQTLILTQILTLKPTWVDATIRSHFGCSYIEKEPNSGQEETDGKKKNWIITKVVVNHLIVYLTNYCMSNLKLIADDWNYTLWTPYHLFKISWYFTLFFHKIVVPWNSLWLVRVFSLMSSLLQNLSGIAAKRYLWENKLVRWENVRQLL